MKRKDKLPKDSEKYRKITELIAECVAEDDQPIQYVEYRAFNRLINYFEPCYEMPSRHYMHDKELPALDTKVRERVQQVLKEVTSISFRTDLWSSDVSPMSQAYAT